MVHPTAVIERCFSTYPGSYYNNVIIIFWPSKRTDMKNHALLAGKYSTYPCMTSKRAIDLLL